MLSIRSVLDDTRPVDRRNAKMVATIGPSSESADVLRDLIKAGVNVFRLNFSHSVPRAHLEVLQNIRKISKEEKRYTSIVQDLPGPKIRISTVEHDVARLADNQQIVLKPADGSRSSNSAPGSRSARPSCAGASTGLASSGSAAWPCRPSPRWRRPTGSTSGSGSPGTPSATGSRCPASACWPTAGACERARQRRAPEHGREAAASRGGAHPATVG